MYTKGAWVREEVDGRLREIETLGLKFDGASLSLSSLLTLCIGSCRHNWGQPREKYPVAILIMPLKCKSNFFFIFFYFFGCGVNVFLHSDYSRFGLFISRSTIWSNYGTAVLSLVVGNRRGKKKRGGQWYWGV